MLNKKVNYGPKYTAKSVPDFKMNFIKLNNAVASSENKSVKELEDDEEDWSQLEQAVLDEKDQEDESDEDFR